MRSLGSIGDCNDDFLRGDFAERDLVERLAIATDTLPRAVIAGHDASVLQRESLSRNLAAWCSRGWALVPPIQAVLLLRRISLHVSNAAISPGLAQAVRGK
jgi:hypothetical protein